MPGIRPLDLHHILGRAGRDDLAALVATLRAEVDDPVGGLDDLQIVFDHDHGVALLHQRLEHVEQFADVFEMEAGGGLVEDVEGVAGGAAAEFLGCSFN